MMDKPKAVIAIGMKSDDASDAPKKNDDDDGIAISKPDALTPQEDADADGFVTYMCKFKADPFALVEIDGLSVGDPGNEDDETPPAKDPMEMFGRLRDNARNKAVQSA